MTNLSILALEYKTAIEMTHDGFWIIDAASGRILDVNDSYCKIIGKTKKEMLALYIFDMEVVQTKNEIIATVKAIVENRSHSFIGTHRCQDGSIIKLEVTAKYSDINGGIIFVFMKDTTERLKFQQAIVGNEKIFRELADNVNDVFWVKTPDRMLYLNKAFEALCGIKREVVYKNQTVFINCVMQEDRQRVKNAFFNRTIYYKQAIDEEYRIIDQDGNIKWIRTRSYPIFDKNGEYIRSVGIASDITIQKLLEDTINRLNHELIKMVDAEMQKRIDRELAFEGIFNASGNCLCLLSEDGIIEEVNERFLRLFEVSKKSHIINNYFKELLSPSEHERAKNKLRQVLSECQGHDCIHKNFDNCGKSPMPYEWKFKKKSGVDVIIFANVTCFEKGDGKKRFVVSFADITRIRELEAKEREGERLLAHQSKMAAMGEMIGAIAHQWRQPLNLLGVLIQDIRYSFYENELNEVTIEKFAASAIKQVDFMSKTIDDFRGFFKSDKEIVGFDIFHQVEKSVSMIFDMLKTHGITITLQALKKPMARGYPNEMGQVMLNLFSNAKDALLEEHNRNITPKIVVTVDADDAYALVEVQDNGGGINESIMGRIFEPYFTTKDEKKGTGIGLYMSKTIIEKNMNGHLSARNSRGGAVFTIQIPLANSSDMAF